jgi:hypothetical protein
VRDNLKETEVIIRKDAENAQGQTVGQRACVALWTREQRDRIIRLLKRIESAAMTASEFEQAGRVEIGALAKLAA